MGRKTYESIGKPLEQRLNIVVTRNRDYLAPGCIVVNTLEDALAKGRDYSEELFVIGGEALFIHALPLCRRIYLTRILANVDGDTFFPEFDGSEFREIVHETFPGPLPYVFSLYERS
jgi:dihydrofolate reductase